MLKSIKPDIIYLQQSGWGHKGVYSKYASYGPIAQAISGLTEQSGLPDPYPPAGWGYSYMDWSGAYYCAITMLLAVYHKKRTGKGQYIDGSQIEPAIYLTGTAMLDFAGQRPPLAADRQPRDRTGPRRRTAPIAAPARIDGSRLPSPTKRNGARWSRKWATRRGRRDEVRHHGRPDRQSGRTRPPARRLDARPGAVRAAGAAAESGGSRPESARPPRTGSSATPNCAI